MKKTPFALCIASLLALALASCNMLSNMTGIAAAGKNHGASLEAYGFHAVSPRAGNAQPMGLPLSTPRPRQQVYLGGAAYNGSKSNILDISAGNAVASAVPFSQSASETSWMTFPHASAGAHLSSASGTQSVVTVVFYPSDTNWNYASAQTIGLDGTVKLVSWDGKSQAIHSFGSGQKVTIGWPESGASTFEMNQSVVSIAAGDVNGDGKDEIGFCAGNYFVVMASDLEAILYQGYVSPGDAAAARTYFHPSRVAAGDIKNDGGCEFVATYGNDGASGAGSAAIFGYDGSKVGAIASVSLSNASCILKFANVAIGDIDGDGYNEAVFGGKSSSNSYGLIAARWSSGSLGFFDAAYTSGSPNWSFRPVPPLAVFNPYGTSVANPKDYIFFGDSMVGYGSSAFSAAFTSGDAVESVTVTDAVAGCFYHGWSGHEDQSQLAILSTNTSWMKIYGLDDTGKFKNLQTISVGYTSPFPSTMSLCAADLQGDSVVLKFIDHQLRYSAPTIVSALASPPYYEDATDVSSFGNAGTSLGNTTSFTASEAASFTIKASFSIGGEGEAPLEGDLAKSNNKNTIEFGFSAGFQFEQEMSYTHAYETMAGQDSVVFACIPYDEYKYTIMSDPSAANIGKTIVIAVPQAAQVINMERGVFNALPGNTLQVGSNVFVHTLGVPGSYMTKSQLDAACDRLGIKVMYDASGVSVSVGDGQLSKSAISYTDSKAATFGTQLSVTTSSEEVLACVLWGTSLGIDINTEFSIGVSDTTEVEGVVPSAKSSDKPFKFGIGLVNKKDVSLQPGSFMVATYWVE